MAERPAALYPKLPTASGEYTQQEQGREVREHQERVCQVDDEDDTREDERQRGLTDEQLIPPAAVDTQSINPHLLLSSKTRADSARQQPEAPHQAGNAAAQIRPEQKANEQTTRDQQQSQATQVMSFEYVWVCESAVA